MVKLERYGDLKNILLREIDGKPEDKGDLYAIKNPYLPGLIKIGMSRNSVYERIRNLGTAYPVDWEIVIVKSMKHVAIAETCLHAYFRQVRVAKNREFFAVSDADVADAIKSCYTVDGLSMLDAILKIG